MIELALRNVSKSYGINEILKDVSFEIRTNDVVGIVGENGAGKTTIFKIIKQIEKQDKGLVDIVFKDSVRIFRTDSGF